MTGTAEAETPTGGALWVPQWAPWVLTFPLMVVDRRDATGPGERIAVLALLGTLLYTTMVCLLLGAAPGRESTGSSSAC